jgi:calcineurin-like phosphoesterase family protein
MARFFTSDLHFGHKNISKYTGRPFADVEEMNVGLIARWNETVADTDEVWVLGDFAFYAEERSRAICKQLRGKRVIVPGNHDRGRDQLRRLGFEVVEPGSLIDVGGFTVKVSHFPYGEVDHTPVPRELEQRPKDEGHWLLHGHVHDLYRVQGRCINVSVEMWDYRPIHEQRIIEILATEGQP